MPLSQNRTGRLSGKIPESVGGQFQVNTADAGGRSTPVNDFGNNKVPSIHDDDVLSTEFVICVVKIGDHRLELIEDRSSQANVDLVLVKFADIANILGAGCEWCDIGIVSDLSRSKATQGKEDSRELGVEEHG